MNDEEFKKYLKERYDDQIVWYDSKSQWNHKAYQVFQWMMIILASLTPVLILIGEEWSKWLSAGVAVLVAIAAGGLKAFKYEENWINYRTTCETLRKEINYFNAGIKGYEQNNGAEKYSHFVDRIESLISRENTLWITAVEKETTNTKTK